MMEPFRMTTAAPARVATIAACSLACLLLASASARAQAAAKPPQGWSGQAQVSIVAATGNSDTRTFGSGGQIEYHDQDEWDAIGRLDGVRSSSDGVATAASLNGLARAAHQVDERLHVFGELKYLRNRFAGISHREEINGGLAVDLVPPGGSQTLQATGSIGYLREAHLVDGLTSAATASGGTRYRLALSEHSSIQDDLTYVENLSDTTDWRISHQASITAAVAASLSLKLSQQLEYLRKPVPGFRRTDTLTSVALVVSF
jgi:putative salt-induced outer membrane protein YdiY